MTSPTIMLSEAVDDVETDEDDADEPDSDNTAASESDEDDREQDAEKSLDAIIDAYSK